MTKDISEKIDEVLKNFATQYSIPGRPLGICLEEAKQSILTLIEEAEVGQTTEISGFLAPSEARIASSNGYVVLDYIDPIGDVLNFRIIHRTVPKSIKQKGKKQC